jgi:anti-anti-sigma regulatory factor
MSDSVGANDVVIRMDGTFDVITARRLAGTLADADPGEEVYVDLTHVREFNDFGIAVLAQALRESPARISLRGLRQHQYRMLRYLGVDPGALEESDANRIYGYQEPDDLSPFDRI